MASTAARQPANQVELPRVGQMGVCTAYYRALGAVVISTVRGGERKEAPEEPGLLVSEGLVPVELTSPYFLLR